MSTKPHSASSELEDRDPNNLSHHLQVSWDDVIGEPDGIRGPECAWRVSNRCFNSSKNCCYIFLSVFLAPITALCLGFTFACLAFEHIWCLTPCLRVWKISCTATRNFNHACAEAVIVPITEALGSCLSRIQVRQSEGSTREKIMSI